ncbi:hypothetical protein KC19_10G161400 [Ceratodon purpureus]|uniref:NB-ARC domain-containing protein n=1 Tax=Ceratodon purpureus TaxID=3225 RepID=A0A8T0GNM6_CERPU|nr:hypothetical protein KC19_10G161400 [Ceratodon purpureus]
MHQYGFTSDVLKFHDLQPPGVNTMDQRGIKRRRDVAENSSSERGGKLCDGVYALHEPEGQPEVEVVFIHGLSNPGLGDSKDAYWTTWLAKDGSDDCWLQTWLADEFPKARILSVSYDANLAVKSSTSGRMDLYPDGESLVQQMVFRDVGIGQNGCPVVWVCHCLGGLVAKQIVVMGHDNFRRDKKIQKLLQSTKAFFFYATPHGGSELVKGSDELGRLNSRFEFIRLSEFRGKWKIPVVAEAHATAHKWFGSSKIVEEDSARYMYGHVMHVPADHFDVCRPESVKSTSYLHLTNCITKIVFEHKESHSKVLKLPRFVAKVDDKLSMLRRKMEKNPTVGLVGMGGIGKTTLSKIMYNLERERYDRSCYLEDVRSCTDFVTLHKKLFQELCDDRWDETEDLEYHLEKIQGQIRNKKVLVIVDDVWTKRSLEDLEVVDAFQNGRKGSKLVITCRDQAILRDLVRKDDTCDSGILEVGGLNDKQARELFVHYAFHEFDDASEMDNEERGEFEDQASEIVMACGGLPLSLEVIGQHLRNQNVLPKDERMEMWKEALERLKAADALEGHKNADERLWAKLRISYDDLGDLEKQLFLDFACILCDLEHSDKNSIVRICKSRGGLETLINSSLLKLIPQSKVSWGSPPSCLTKYELVMHDQLRDLGRRIVMDRAKGDIRKQIHVWNESGMRNLLESKKGSKFLEGLSSVGMQRLGSSESEEDEVSNDERTRSYGYPQMRLLNLSRSGVDVVDYFLRKCLQKANLFRLHWLCLSETDLTKEHLGVLDRRFMNLHVLQLWGCRELYELPSSIRGLTSLEELDVSSCRNLEKVPDEIGNLGQLLKLHISHCSRLKRLPLTLGNLKQLKLLNLSGCLSLEEIPASVGHLTKLEYLLLSDCYRLHTMCEFETRMPHLSELNLSDCESLKSFKSLGNLNRLQALNMSRCHRLRIPNIAECLGQMSRLQHLTLSRFDHGGHHRRADGGTKEKGHFDFDATFLNLESLRFGASPRDVILPVCPRLKVLDLWKSRMWCDEELLDLDLWKSRMWCNEELPESFSESFGNLTELQELNMWYFRTVPESLGNLTQLRILHLKRIRKFPDSLTKLVGLEHLYCERSRARRLPEHVGLLASLQTLELYWYSELVELPVSVGQLAHLRSLKLVWCKKLKRLPECLAELPELSELNLWESVNLDWKEEGQHAMLKQLHERGCKITRPDGLDFLGSKEGEVLLDVAGIDEYEDAFVSDEDEDGAVTRRKRGFLSLLEK